MADVVIMGAGPAGLAAGYALARAGRSVRIVEQADILGGLARTVERDGFRFDIGGHRWFTKKDELNHFLVELLDDELLHVDRISRVYFDGKFVDYPLRLGNVVGKIGPARSVRAAGDYLVSRVPRRPNDQTEVSMEDAYVAQFGRTLYEMFFRRYSEKVWGRGCDELSGDWVTQRSRGLSLFTTLKDSVKRSNNQVESLVERFMYPARGYGRISERLADEITSRGGRIEMGRRVVRVRHDARYITGLTVSDGSREYDVDGKSFISSIPMTELLHALQPSVSSELLAAADSLTFRDLMTVHLMLDRPQVSPDTWLYVHDPRVSFARLHEPPNWSSVMAPPGKTSLVLEVFCNVGDETWQMSDEAVRDRAIADLSDMLGFIHPREVQDGFVIRSRDAYPRYSLRYRPAVDAIKQHLRSFENLQIVGRGGTFRYNNADHSIETGLIAAGSLLGDERDVDSVNSEAEYLEERRLSKAAHRRAAG